MTRPAAPCDLEAALRACCPALTPTQAQEIADALTDGGLVAWADVLTHGWGDVAFKYADGKRVTTDLHRSHRPTRAGA